MQAVYVMSTGLDRNNYDKDACLSVFQAYKDCKKAEVIAHMGSVWCTPPLESQLRSRAGEE